jgi:O-methyltransferase domain
MEIKIMSTQVTQNSPAIPPYAAAAQHTAPTPNPAEIAFQAGLGYIVSACLNVALKLRIPDLIGDGIADVKTLAHKAGAHEDYLYRVLRVLESSQIVSRAHGRGYELTPAGQLLRRNVPGSLAPALEWIADPLHLSLYSNLQQSIVTGATTFDAVYGEPFFQWSTRKENAEEAAVFNNAMTSISEMCIPAFLEAYPFGAFAKIVDVGGGHGAVLRAILKQHPEVKGTLAEMPSLLPDARVAIANDGLAGRCEAAGCNFFEAVPSGGDLYFMKHIIHDWADEPAIRLLKNIRAVIPANGTLLLAEAVLEDSAAPHLGKLIDIEMIAFVGGKERTAEEFRQLLAAAGFALRRIVQTKAPLSLVEAVPF